MSTMSEYPILFGTNGIRCIVNQEMTTDLAMNIGKACGTYIMRNAECGMRNSECGIRNSERGTQNVERGTWNGERGTRNYICVGVDTRTSNIMLKNALLSGIVSTGVNIIDFGIIATPALQYAVKKLKYDMGVLITASHNPPEFNGIKCVSNDGSEFTRSQEEVIEKLYHTKEFVQCSWDRIGTIEQSDIARKLYIEGVKEHVNSELIKSKKFKILLDCSNGASCYTSPYLFEQLGCEVTTLNAHPDGTFPGHLSEPTPENLANTIKIMKSYQCDVCIVHDGDADRTVFIDEKGTYIPGEKSMALIAKYLTKKHSGGTVVTPISTSSIVETAIKPYNGKIIYTQVGSPTIARVMKESRAIFGGEENGGLIFPEHQYTRDGAMTGAMLLEILASESKPLSELISELPNYTLIKTKVHCPNEMKNIIIEKAKEYYKEQELNTLDGVKIFFDDAWILIRMSGTEPLCRIFAESKNAERAKKLCEETKKMVMEWMTQIESRMQTKT